MPLIQDPRKIRVLRESNIGSLVQQSYADAIGFENNQFKKQKVDRHDQVISMLHATKEAMQNPVSDHESSDNHPQMLNPEE